MTLLRVGYFLLSIGQCVQGCIFWLSVKSKTRALGHKVPGIPSSEYSHLIPIVPEIGTGSTVNLPKIKCLGGNPTAGSQLGS